MCNRYGIKAPIRAMADELARLALPIVDPAPHAMPNFEPREDIRPTNCAPILRPVDGGLQLTELRWGLIPWFHAKPIRDWKPLTTNCRIETAATTASYKHALTRRRCLVPASHFFEWTGEKGSKTKWRFTRADAEWFSFAGLWDRCETPEGELQSFTILTTAPGPDAIDYHNRQPVVLEPADYGSWLDVTTPAARFQHAGPAGTLQVQRAEPERLSA